MSGRIRKKLETGSAVTGMINFVGHPAMIEIMARAGFDFAIIDMEHCPLDLKDVADLVRAADAAGIAPFVRVPDVDAALIKRVLNLGVQGIVLPHASRERCERLVDAVLYPPEGSRGACPVVRATRYWPDSWDDYARAANRDIIIMPLIEDPEAIDDFAAMAQLPGISAFFIGPYDLSVSIGAPGVSFDHPKMREALELVLQHATRHGKYVFTTIGDRQDKDYVRSLIAAGVRGIIFATDALAFLQSCRRLVSQIEAGSRGSISGPM